MRNRITILIGTLTVFLFGVFLGGCVVAPTPISAVPSIVKPTVTDSIQVNGAPAKTKFNALVITYNTIDEKGTQQLSVRLDYEYLQSDGSTLKNMSQDVALSASEISTLTNFINSKMSMVK
jgi:hypothetical protein